MAAKLSGQTTGRYTVSQNSEINVTPFVDVMLVLLIIFMVAAPLATKSLRLTLPPPDASPTPVAPPTVVTIQRSGAIYIDASESSTARLAADLDRKFAGGGATDRRVFLRADEEVAYARFMTVMNTLRTGGYRDVALVGEDFGA